MFSSETLPLLKEVSHHTYQAKNDEIKGDGTQDENSETPGFSMDNIITDMGVGPWTCLQFLIVGLGEY